MKPRTWIILLSSIFIGLVIVFFVIRNLMSRPLGPSLSNDLAMQTTQNSDPLSGPTSTPNAAITPLPIITLKPELTQGPPLCGQTPVLYVLLSGIDFRGDNYLYGLADVIRVVRIDFTIPSVTILALDRDLWVEIPGIQEHYGITHGKLNQAYFYGVPAMGYYEGKAGGSGLLARTLNHNFSLVADNYLVVSMAAFVKGVDVVGGIDVDLPQSLDGKPSGLSSFPAGRQHLDGTRALDLARIREGYSSLIRISNQNIIIKGLMEKVLSPEIITRVPALISALKGTIMTDLSPNQINDMVCLLTKINRDNVNFAEIPNDYYAESSIYDPAMKETVFVWDIDFNIIRAYVQEFQNGRWP